MTAPVRLLELPAGRAARVLALRSLRGAAEARRRLRAPDDAEALHDFRVALRRLRSTLRHHRAHLEDGVARRDRRRLRRLARATGAARDAEVGIALLESWRDALPGAGAAGADWLLDRLRGRREGAARGLRRGGFEKARGRLEARLREHRTEVDPDRPRGEPPFAEVVRGRLAAGAAELRGRLDAVRGEDDQDEAHRARISAKRLRYLLEPVARELPGLPALVRRLKELQEALGRMHDAEVMRAEALAALEGLGDAPASPDLRTGLRALAARAAGERARWFAELEAAWLGGRAAGFFAEAGALERRLGPAEEAPEPRRFLLRRMPGLRGVEPEEVEQGWLPGERLVETLRRVRAGKAERWVRTVEARGAVLAEEEVPPEVGRALWKLTRGRRVRKRRWRVEDQGLAWTVERFLRRGPVLAEVELPANADGPLTLPEWLARHVDREVTGDADFTDRGLAG